MLIRRYLHAGALTSILLGLTASGVLCQCRPPHSSNEAKLLAFYSVPIVFSAETAALSPHAGSVRVSVEGAYVPGASATLQQTHFCYTGRAEDTGLTSFFARPRIAISLPYGFGLEASYLPPVTVAGATPSLGSGGLWFTRAISSSVLLTARFHATVGTVKGPITCPRSALQQANSQAPCYGTRESTDEFRPDMTGVEIIASTHRGSHDKLQFSAGIGMNQLYPRFKVGFSDLSGGTDRTQIAVNLSRLTALAGTTLRLSQRCDASAQLYSSFTDASTVRAMFGCLLRK
jgi:hypothetical protein